MEIDATGPPGEISRVQRLRELLSKPRVKWAIVILSAIILLTVVLVVTILSLKDDRGLMELWPRQNDSGNLIHFEHGSSNEGWREMTYQLDRLLSQYTTSFDGTVVKCRNGIQLEDNKVCEFSREYLEPACSRGQNYGYHRGSPCIFLVFNKIADWVPEPYTRTELKNYVDLPDESPVDYLVYLDCQGDTPIDQENMGRIEYSPLRGFPTYFFPYRGQPGYMSPIVGVKFVRPTIGVAISVTCKLWAKNIKHADGTVPSGKISFILLVD